LTEIAHTAHQPRWLKLTGLAGVVGLCVAYTSFFWQSEASFISGEDTILRLPLLSGWHNGRVIFSSFFTSYTDAQYRPLSYFALAALRTAVPLESARVWQLCLLAFQALNVVLVYGVAKMLTDRVAGGAVAAALFALHPLGAVMVNHVAHFHHLLGLSFFLGSLLSYFWGAHTGRWRWYVASVVLCALGLLTTKAVVALPLVITAYELAQRRPWRKGILRLMPHLLLAAAALVLWRLPEPPPLLYQHADLPPGTWHRSLISVIAGGAYYVAGLLTGRNIPVILTEVVERRSDGVTWEFLCPAALWALALAWGVRLLWQARPRGREERGVALSVGGNVGLAVVWGLATFLPYASTGWNPVNAWVAWPYVYFPLVALALLAGVLGSVAARAGRGLSFLLPTGLVAICGVCFGGQLIRLNVAAGSAASYWEQVRDLSPKSERASVALGKLELREGRVHRALPLLYNANVEMPKASSLAMAEHYLSQGETLAAAIHSQTAWVPTPGLRDQDTKILTARILWMSGALDHAEATWGEVLLADPYNTVALRQVAEIWQAKGFRRAAHRLIARAIEIDPHDRTLKQRQRRLDREADQRHVATLAPVRDLRYLITSEDHPSVHKKIAALTERFGADPALLMAAGMSFARLGDYHASVEKLEAASPHLPTSPLLWAIKCFAYEGIGAYPEAGHAADEAIRLVGESASPLCIVGTALLRLGKHQRGLDCLRRAVEIDPTYQVGHTNLALGLQAAGLSQEAEKHFRRAAKLRPDQAQVHADLGAHLLTQSRVDEALQRLRTALRIAPELASAHAYLGAALMRKGLKAEAAKHVQMAERLSPGAMRRLPYLPGAMSLQTLKQWGGEPGS